MKPTTVTAHYERKLNTGDYSSVTLGTWATVELEEGDTAEDALAHGMELCREAVKEAAAPFRKNGQPVTAEEKFAGLRVNNTIPDGARNGKPAKERYIPSIEAQLADDGNGNSGGGIEQPFDAAQSGLALDDTDARAAALATAQGLNE